MVSILAPFVLALVHRAGSIVSLRPAVKPGSILRIESPEDQSSIISPRDRRAFTPVASCLYQANSAAKAEEKIWVGVDDPALTDTARVVARIAFRSWEQAELSLGLSIPLTLDRKRIVILLSDGGQPGGEQMVSNIIQYPSGLPTSYVFIDQMKSLTDPVERLREVTHEMGHALFPAIGGFDSPESWSNGYMGERVLPAILLESVQRQEMDVSDLGGAEPERVQTLVNERYMSSADQIAFGGRNPALEQGTSEAAFFYAVAIASYAHAILPTEVFKRGLALGRGSTAGDLTRGLEDALAEQDSLQLRLSKHYTGRTIWIPGRFATVKGAKVIRTEGVWSKLSTSGSVVNLSRN